MRIISAANRAAVNRLLEKDERAGAALDARVRAIVEGVRRQGDRALLRFAQRFDGVKPPIEVSAAEMRQGAARVPVEVRRAIEQAASSIARVAFKQIPLHWDATLAPGVFVEQRVEPLARVGCYVPGGRFPLPSSLLMTAIPARVAGVPEVIAVCPRPEPAVMAAALEAGVTRLFRVGGAHAIAALAYGTKTVPRVDKIVGPGNRYVASAKSLVSRDCAIDFFAGPTEIVVVAGSGRAAWIAADLVAQAEHDPDARSIFITWSRALGSRVAIEVKRQVRGRDVAKQAIAAHGAVIVVRGPAEAMELSNRIAPEHLVLGSEALTQHSIVAGSIFVGEHTAQASGDYAIGSNHVLPTAGAARFRGGLTAADFMRVMSVQRLTRAGLARVAPTAIALADAEGLDAHAASIRVRIGER